MSKTKSPVNVDERQESQPVVKSDALVLCGVCKNHVSIPGKELHFEKFFLSKGWFLSQWSGKCPNCGSGIEVSTDYTVKDGRIFHYSGGAKYPHKFVRSFVFELHPTKGGNNGE